MAANHSPLTEHLSRRGFLHSMAGGTAGAALANLLSRDGALAHEGQQATSNGLHFPAQAKACIFIYLVGGPSQIDMYDPKPKLNQLDGQPLPQSVVGQTRFAFIEKETAKIWGSPYRFRKHGESGIEVSELLPHLAKQVDDLTFIRSMHTDQFNHHPAELMMNTGFARFGFPSVGSWLNYGLGSISENLPGYVVLTAGTASTAGASSWSSGFLPGQFQGVTFRNSGEAVLNLANPYGICPTVQANTVAASARLNEMNYRRSGHPELLSRIESYEMAYRMQASLPELTDLSQESRKTFEDYGMYRLAPQDLRGWEGGRSRTYQDFSRNCLMARRLVERGVRFVNVYHASWDHHSLLEPNIRRNCQVVDQPIAYLIQDLKQRGLLDSTLVVCASEFGRTPLAENKINNPNPSGRDHHPFAFTIWMAGAGLPGGRVIGASDELGWGVQDRPVHVHDFHATMLHLFGIDHEQLTFSHGGREHRLTDVAGEVIPEILG